MASDFPEKVWLAKYGSGKTLISTRPAPVPTRRVQPYFSASLVEELVEELTEVGKWLASEDGPTTVVQSIEAAVSKAQSSLGVKG